MKNIMTAIPTELKENGEKSTIPGSSPEPPAAPAAKRYGLDIADMEAGDIVDHVIIATESVSAEKSASLEQTVEKEDTHLPFGMIRQIIAERLTLSKQTIPHFYLTIDVDMTDLLNWRQEVNKDHDSRITITDLIIKAVADTLPQYQRINAHVEADKLIVKKDISIGIVVAIDDGLLVPVIPHTNQKSLQEISDWSKKLSDAARRGSINFNNVGTFTISTLGTHGIKNFQTIINPPECAILSVGAVEQRVVAYDGSIQIRNMMSLNLAADHRAIDGTYAAAFLDEIKRRLEKIEITNEE